MQQQLHQRKRTKKETAILFVIFLPLFCYFFYYNFLYPLFGSVDLLCYYIHICSYLYHIIAHCFYCFCSFHFALNQLELLVDLAEFVQLLANICFCCMQHVHKYAMALCSKSQIFECIQILTNSIVIVYENAIKFACIPLFLECKNQLWRKCSEY